MSITRIQAIETDNNVPKVDIDSTVNNVPKFPVDLQGGGSPIDLQSISISENGTTEAPEGVAYNEIIVDVPQTTLTSITITENGTTTAPSGTAYNEIVVDVEGEPETLILCNSDYSTSENDSITGVKEYSGNCTYQASEGFVNMIYDDNRGQYRHNWICNQSEKYNYEYEVELGVIDRGVRNSNNYLFSFYRNQNTTSGAECELYWDYIDQIWKLHHSSGTSIMNEIPMQSDIFSNSITKLFIENDYVSGTSTKNGFIYIQNENINNGAKTLLHDIGYPWNSRYLCIGNKGNNDGFYNIQVKKVKLTRKLNHNFE